MTLAEINTLFAALPADTGKEQIRRHLIDALYAVEMNGASPDSQGAPKPVAGVSPYCLLCEKAGHQTEQCWSTHGLNRPRDHELFRLASAASDGAQAAGQDARDAARYRKIRRHYVDILLGDLRGRPITVKGDGEFGDEKDGKKLDDVLDALKSAPVAAGQEDAS